MKDYKGYIVVNKVVLGKRTVGFECYSTDKKEIIGYTEKQLKDLIQSDGNVLNMFINETGELNLIGNMMNKIGINTFSPMYNTTGMVADMYFLIDATSDKVGTTYHFMNQRYGTKMLTEQKLKALYELSDGANINGISIEDDKIKIWFDAVNDNQSNTVKK
jgi:hypothetical protein